jgi:hypothetical protein
LLNLDVEVADIRNVEADVIVLKYAAGHHGADLMVAQALGSQELFVQLGQYRLFSHQREDSRKRGSGTQRWSVG